MIRELGGVYAAMLSVVHESNLLPEDAEATIDIPADEIQYLKIACDLLQKPVTNFITEKLPNWIIVDFFHHWAVDIAQDLNIAIIRFRATTASTAVFFWAPEFIAGDHEGQGQVRARPSSQHLTMPPEWVDFPSKVAYKSHEASVVHNVYFGVNASGVSDGARIAKILQASPAVAIRTCFEFEADYLRLHQRMTEKPAIPVGFLPPEKPQRKSMTEEPWVSVFNWLDKQKPRSEVFIRFGSETKLSKEQIHEIAYGVELSGLPFLWALRKPDGVDNDLDALPPEFSTRTAAQGVVHLGWAPQREILGHPSIGGSFFHAGWGSIIEAIQFGHVLVLLPFVIDQPLNARMMVEKGLGIEVDRAEDGSFTYEK